MKKKGVMKLFLISILFVFLFSGVFAVEEGTCDIVARSECDDLETEGYVVMGVSSLTNAHGELASEEIYDYVVCCNILDGNTTCNPEDDPDNKVIGLSSSTNAHAEIPSEDNYGTNVCYEDFSCGRYSTCPEEYIGILSLSDTTNAHIGGIEDYDTKICCISELAIAASCTFTSAKWNIGEAIEGQKVYLQVTGSGAECDGQSVSFSVIEGGLISQGPAEVQPLNVSFNGNSSMGTWNTEWVNDLGSNPEYYFIASLVDYPETTIESSDPKLVVTEISEDYCATITTCEDYTIKEECESDDTLCEVAESGSLSEVDCSEDSIICGCTWDDDTSTCEFGWNEIEDCGNPESGCDYGCTLCSNDTGTYCNLGATCDGGEIPGNNNGTCDFGIDGCLSDDCSDGDRDTCISPYYCSLGKCSSVEGPSVNLGKCTISQTIEKNCDEDPVGYKTITWTGIWTGDDCGTACEKCETGGKTTIPCPAQIQLPFFDNYQVIIAIMVIVGIYVLIIFRKKILKKKGKKKR